MRLGTTPKGIRFWNSHIGCTRGIVSISPLSMSCPKPLRKFAGNPSSGNTWTNTRQRCNNVATYLNFGTESSSWRRRGPERSRGKRKNLDWKLSKSRRRGGSSFPSRCLFHGSWQSTSSWQVWKLSQWFLFNFINAKQLGYMVHSISIICYILTSFLLIPMFLEENVWFKIVIVSMTLCQLTPLTLSSFFIRWTSTTTLPNTLSQSSGGNTSTMRSRQVWPITQLFSVSFL